MYFSIQLPGLRKTTKKKGGGPEFIVFLSSLVIFLLLTMYLHAMGSMHPLQNSLPGY